MKEFAIRLASVQDVQEFVALATSRIFSVHVRDRYNEVNGKSFMEMFCLNYSHPLFAVVDCDEEQLHQLQQEMHQFLA